MDRDLGTRLRDLSSFPILIVYGEKDDVMGREKLSDVGKLPRVKLAQISDMGHVAQPSYDSRITAVMRTFLKTNGESGNKPTP